MRGYVYGLLAPICWGVAATIVKMGLGEDFPPVIAALVANLVALPLTYPLILLLLRSAPKKLPDRRGLLFVFISSIMMTLANLFYFVAIDLEPISVAVPMSNLSPMITLVFAYFFLRRERITPRLIVGTLISLGGVYLIATH